MKILIVLGLFLTYLVIPASVFSGGPTPSPTSQSPFQNLLPIIQTASQYKFPQYTVTNVIIVPADVELDPDYPRLVSEAVKKVQERYSEILGGQTFRINEANGDPIILKVNLKLREFCQLFNYCDFSKIKSSYLPEAYTDGRILKEGIVINYFVAGAPFAASGFWEQANNVDSGETRQGERILASLKGKKSQTHEIFCEALVGRRCSAEYGLYVIAHEMGHVFGLSSASRWARSHPCSTLTPQFCAPDLDPKFYPGPEEANRSIIGYGINAGRFNIEFNDSCVNPEKTLLKHSRYFGGPGYTGLNFEQCLGEGGIGISVKSIEKEGENNSPEFQAGEQVFLITDGLLESDTDIKVLFPPENPSRKLDKIGPNKLKAVIPENATRGYVIITANRNGQDLKSDPFPISITRRDPIINDVLPKQAKVGDIVTLTGGNFSSSAEVQQSRVVVYLGRTLVEASHVLEYSNNKIRFKVPPNTSIGKVSAYVEVIRVNTVSKEVASVQSNDLPIEIIGESSLRGKIVLPYSEIILGKPVEITALIEPNLSAKSAELWIKYSSDTLSPLCENRVSGEWCRITAKTFQENSPPDEFKILTQYTPNDTTGNYDIVLNIQSKDGPGCSGDPGRPPDWMDCGPESRAGIYVRAASIGVRYRVENQSGEEIKVEPEVCRSFPDGGLGCIPAVQSRQRITFNISPNKTELLDIVFSENPWNFVPMRFREDYIISCRIFTVNSNKTRDCPRSPVSSGSTIVLSINFTDQEIQSSVSIPTPPPTPSSTPTQLPAPMFQQDEEDSRGMLGKKAAKDVLEILVQGGSVYKKGQMDLNTVLNFTLPNVVVKGATHTVPITINYSDGRSFSRNIVFRYKLAGTQKSEEKALPGEECGPQRFSCFATAERKDNNPEFLFCRNLGEITNNRYEWVTQKFTTDICQGKEGITATCGDGQGGEVKYWCTGETWVDENQWAAIQKQKEEERQKQGELSCSLWASSEKIKENENITWVIQSNFRGVSGEWRGTDNGSEINPVPVSDLTNTNYWSQTYSYKDTARYTRSARLKTEDGRECVTNTVEVVVEKRELAEIITAPVQNVTAGSKRIDKIIITIPPYGQQRVINQGEPIRFSLPNTGGVPQTIQLPITIIYSDGSTNNKTISFAYKGNTCALSNGKCANDRGQTRDGYQCSTYRSDLTGCSIEKDNVYPHCYTGCSFIPTQVPALIPTPAPIVIPAPSLVPEQTPTPQTSGCPGQCATSVGDTASGQKCTDWLRAYDDACPTGIYDYCFTNCQ